MSKLSNNQVCFNYIYPFKFSLTPGSRLIRESEDVKIVATYLYFFEVLPSTSDYQKSGESDFIFQECLFKVVVWKITSESAVHFDGGRLYDGRKGLPNFTN